MEKKVYIVHCIDTEGPMNETLDASFERLYDLFGIELNPTRENMLKIQNKEFDFGEITDTIADVFAEKRINMHKDWNQIDQMLDEIQSNEYRKAFPDSNGNGWKYSWFCMDHVGFTGINPRHRDAGFHNIYDHYYNRLKQNANGDIIQFHYHPLPFCGDFNKQGTAYVAGENLFEILARDVIDRHFFPTAYRPGFHVERPDSHWFLEQWIPFDYGNQAMRKTDTTKQSDTARGRFGNWNNAPIEWFPYNPSYDDYRKKGSCHRYITRCLNMDARHGMLSQQDVNEAFEYAANNGKAILAFTDHDFRNMKAEIDRVRELIVNAHSIYSDVEFYYEDAVTAMQQVLGLRVKDFQLSISEIGNGENGENALIRIQANDIVFGVQPFLAIKTKTGKYYWDNLDFPDEENTWYYTLDEHTFKREMVECIGVGANDRNGNVSVVTYNFK